MTPVFPHGQLRLYLLKLLEESPRHGYDVIAVLEDRFLGLYSPSAGTVYPRLARLEEDGLVAHQQIGGRKVYRLTAAGREELAARRAELAELEAEIGRSASHLAREVRSEVRGSVRNLKAELKAAAREVRREARSATRAGPGLAELDRLLAGLRAGVLQAAARRPPDTDAIARCRAAVDEARRALLAALDQRPSP